MSGLPDHQLVPTGILSLREMSFIINIVRQPDTENIMLYVLKFDFFSWDGVVVSLFGRSISVCSIEQIGVC